MTKPKVLFIGDLNKDLPEYAQFIKKVEPVFYELPDTKEQLIHDFRTKLNDIQAIYGAWLGFVLLGGFTGEILEAAPKSLRVVSICSVGHEPYNGAEMAKKNIILTNVPSDGAAKPVAELVLYYTLSAFRNFPCYFSSFSPSVNHTVKTRSLLDSNKFDCAKGRCQLEDHNGYSFGHYMGGRPCLSPNGHNAVIVGFGNIGQTIARYLSNVGMNIHYVKRRPLSEKEESQLGFPVQYHKTLLDARDVADLIVIACPGTPETYHMVDANVINSMSKPFRIINIGRGPVIDEQALVDGLKSGKVLFAGLDVFEKEPAVHPELYNRQDVVLTPHIGASTKENFDYTAIMAMKNIENVLLEGGEGISRVN
ncbi:hypothetical protein ACI3LY_000906 [Candidozyma auris]|uniref:D-isomer specific 2-hydroxyacid dehydrogenase NAD-binding domain-containing protein n=2 Tax=Candidozyma auris TaxID=498019 RepID=A0A2H1A749_CANAR|nr:hypothetical_protein [[Candida] auris]KNE00640.1 hypothetical protein QG37_02677 [[Candida] auris]PIS57124.1 hypothetical protein CJI97_000149 [[Candida] auris]PIS58696.1 hypothetical protein B9J08_000144 [[Candida] auris]QEO20763.1 hypothetical_protein [[Candida] auris]QWW23029.1 hypothetical protein CA7LBN_001830 [[Candida] auris]